MTMPSQQDTSWSGLLSTALNIGAQFYQGTVARRQAKARAKAQANDFPQLGMGLANTGPQRGTMLALGGGPSSTRIGIFDSAGAGVGYSSSGGTDMPDDGTSSVQVMRGSRFPTQLVVYTTPTGQMHVGGYRSIGQPMLWTSDLAAVRRVARVARKLGRFVHHRRPR